MAVDPGGNVLKVDDMVVIMQQIDLSCLMPVIGKIIEIDDVEQRLVIAVSVNEYAGKYAVAKLFNPDEHLEKA